MTGNGPLSKGRVSHVFITVCDFSAMVRFYRDVLGLRLLYSDEESHAFFSLSDNTDFQLALYSGRKSRGEDRSQWFMVVDVDDIEHVVAGLRAGQVDVGAIEDVPFGRAATFEDPEGNIIEVHQSA
ncbi:MAG TPA: VOC family protein [Candidatus Kapabacteria bacterium]|nr:VOC family protein [Candidatus Kapabacteria bacterium]